MSKLSLDVSIELAHTSCCVCGTPIVMSSELMQKRRRDHADFYCPNGHQQRFLAQSVEEQLRKQLEDERRKLEFARNEIKAHEERAKKQEAETARLKRRVGNGTCPSCHRTFSQLARHMSTKHPDYADG